MCSCAAQSAAPEDSAVRYLKLARAAPCVPRATWRARQGRYNFEQRAARSAALEDSAPSLHTC